MRREVFALGVLLVGIAIEARFSDHIPQLLEQEIITV